MFVYAILIATSVTPMTTFEVADAQLWRCLRRNSITLAYGDDAASEAATVILGRCQAEQEAAEKPLRTIKAAFDERIWARMVLRYSLAVHARMTQEVQYLRELAEVESNMPGSARP